MIQLFYGPNGYKIRQSTAKAVSEYQDKHGEDSTVQIEALTSDWATLQQSLGGISLFADGQKLVVLREASENKEIAEKLGDQLEQLVDSVQLIIIDSNIDKRSSLYKKLKKHAVATEFKSAQDHELVAWIVDQAKEFGGSIDRASAQQLLNFVGTDQILLSSEIDKLINYDVKITKESIAELVEPRIQETIFQLLDTITSGNQKKALQIYQALRDSQLQPIYILTMIAWQVHNIHVVSLAKDRSDAQVAKEAKMSPFVVSKARGTARKLGRANLIKIIEETAAVDIRLKTIKVDPDNTLKTLILELCTIIKP